MIDETLYAETQSRGGVPLVWVSIKGQPALNLGDALSPIMVTLLSGLPVVQRPHRASTPRMAAVGTIGQILHGGTVSVWGTGVSRHADPHAARKTPFTPPKNTRFRIHATRGPVSRALFGTAQSTGAAAFGDPVWMLPYFYRPTIPKRFDLGVIVHLGDLERQVLLAQVKPDIARYRVPENQAERVILIDTITPVGIDAIRERLDLILSCRRIVSTSLHGLVIPESYGIPCLYFAPRGSGRGLCTRTLDPDDGYDLRVTDLYLGLGRRSIPVYIQPRKTMTDWDQVIAAIDKAWSAIDFDTGPLAEAFPLPLAPLVARPGETVFDDPVIRSIDLRRPSLRETVTGWFG